MFRTKVFDSMGTMLVLVSHSFCVTDHSVRVHLLLERQHLVLHDVEQQDKNQPH